MPLYQPHDLERVELLIDRIVSAAQIANAADREDLRRELWSHFDEARRSPEGIEGALRRFGSEAHVGESLRRVYRWDYAVLYLGKIALSMVACSAAALTIQALVNLRLEMAVDAWRLAPGFSHAAAMSVGVVFGLVTAWEIGRRRLNLRRAVLVCGAYAALCAIFSFVAAPLMGPFVTATMLVGVGSVCSKLPRWPARLLVALLAFAATLYLRHLALNIDFGATRATISGGVYVAVWASTLGILGRLDNAFGTLFGSSTTHAV